MLKIRCLYWDDDPMELDRFKLRILRAWRGTDLRFEMSIVTKSDDPETMTEFLKTEISKYHIFVSDLSRADSDDPDRADPAVGQDFIRDAREVNKNLVIVALTNIDSTTQNEIEKIGGDFVVMKSNLINSLTAEKSINMFTLNLEKYCREKDAFPIQKIPKLEWDVSDLRLKAVLNPKNEEALTFFIREFYAPLSKKASGLGGRSSTVTKAVAHYIRPGYSGAYVINVDCKIEYELEDGSRLMEESHSLILKISQNKRELSDELFNREKVAQSLPSMFVNFTGFDKIIPRDGWFCLGARMEPEAMTFSKWVVEGNEIQDVLSSIFLASGTQQAHANKQISTEALKEIHKTLDDVGRAKIMIAEEEMSEVFCHLIVGFESELKAVLNFLYAGSDIGDIAVESINEDIDLCYCHGDLHSENILVYQSRQARFIDPANFDLWPWMVDIVRLSVSLIASCLDTNWKSYDWNRMESWVEMCDCFISGADISQELCGDGSETNQRVVEALNWIRKNLNKIHPGFEENQLEGQFLMGLAIEFMRCSYRTRLTSPKRCLGLIASGRAIFAAEKAYKKKFALT